MGKIKRYKNRVEIFLSGESGQRFFNFAYSIGAAIVIWGALFKILHLPGGNALLAIGMGTEVLMFILTAFDRPPRHYNWEEVFPVLDSHDPADREAMLAEGATQVQGNMGGNISINLNGQPGDGGEYTDGGVVVAGGQGGAAIAAPGVELPDLAPMADVSENYVTEMERVIQELGHLRETTNALNTLYEMQLRSISQQLGAIEGSGREITAMREMMERSARQSEKYCEETEKMAQNMATLNSIYAGMIAAMSANRNN